MRLLDLFDVVKPGAGGAQLAVHASQPLAARGDQVDALVGADSPAGVGEHRAAICALISGALSWEGLPRAGAVPPPPAPESAARRSTQYSRRSDTRGVSISGVTGCSGFNFATRLQR